MRPSLRRSLIATALLSVAALASPAPASAQVSSVCPATFHVLHDDSIGKLKLPKGQYDVSVRGGLSCAAASDLFREFLEDFDGVLPRPWRINVAAASFSRGSSGVGFSVALTKSPDNGGGGRHPATGTRCPGTFRVLHDDRIGALRLPAGNYRITLLSTNRMTCSRASTLFARFLQDFDGVLPRPWALDVATATFRRGAGHVGFRVKPSSGSATGGGGSGVHPRNAQRCPGSFRVLNATRIGKLRLPRGPYRITLLKGGGLTCQQASSQFTRFLDEDFAGMLPSPWRLNVESATFTRGRPNVGFRVKPTGRVAP